MFDYPINLEIEYINDFEYRWCIRNLFKHPSLKSKCDNKTDNSIGNGTDNDDITLTLDELDYDEFSSSVFLKEVFSDTSTNKELMLLYKSAAAVMFSTDENTGFVVLLAYDNLDLFHKCLCMFYKTNTCLDNPYYTELLKKFIC
jgi:hypothetical protein